MNRHSHIYMNRRREYDGSLAAYWCRDACDKDTYRQPKTGDTWRSEFEAVLEDLCTAAAFDDDDKIEIVKQHIRELVGRCGAKK